MLKFENVELLRGGRVVLRDVNLEIHPGSKVGVAGSNGAGKTSLLELIGGDLHADSGTVTVAKGVLIARVAQELAVTDRIAIEHVLDGDAQLRRLQSELRQAEQADDGHRQALIHGNLADIDAYTGLNKHFGFFLTTSSMHLFGNYKVIPFIASIALLVLTYFVTFEITQKRFAGIVAMLIVLQSGIFLFYDTAVVYPNFWIVFYLLSLYLVYKKWPLSPISYILSVTSKGLTAVFFPMTLFFIYRANITNQKKIRLAISYGIIVLLGGIVIFLWVKIWVLPRFPFLDSILMIFGWDLRHLVLHYELMVLFYCSYGR